jgi:hypothetical protein
MVFAGILFALSLLGIAALFALKRWEMARERVLLPHLRARGDVRAQQLKELATAARMDLAKIPPEAVRTARIMVHEGALAFAALARFLERQAHRLADFVSHKRGFEKRETRSEFLKKVAEHKTDNGLDTEE